MLRTNKKNSRSATQALRLFYMYKKGKKTFTESRTEY